MNIFDEPAAKHYCSHFATNPGVAAGSQTSYVASMPFGPILEGTPGFDFFRDCALREAERSLFLAITKYRKALDLMTPAASSWAHVTLYYSAYFAARSLLGMFGAWVGNKRIVEVAANTPGSQRLSVRSKRAISTYRGSHEQFWDIFYGSIATLTPWIDAAVHFAVLPVGGSIVWQTQTRNDLNYDSFNAVQLAVTFQTTFNSAAFPNSLPGSLNTQFSVTEGLLRITSGFAADFGLATDALASLAPTAARAAKISQLVFRDRAPGVLRKTKWKKLIV